MRGQVNHGLGVVLSGAAPFLYYRVVPIFEPPTDLDVTFVEPFRGGPANALMRFVRPSERGRNVFVKTDGTITEDEPPFEEIRTVYWGGHLNEVTDAEAAALTAAGYGAFIS